MLVNNNDSYYYISSVRLIVRVDTVYISYTCNMINAVSPVWRCSLDKQHPMALTWLYSDEACMINNIVFVNSDTPRIPALPINLKRSVIA